MLTPNCGTRFVLIDSREPSPERPHFTLNTTAKFFATVEAASQLRYEGAAFTACVFVTKQEQWLSEAIGVSFVRLARPLPFRPTLLEEKWIRSLADGATIGLVALGHGHGLVGIVTIPSADDAVPGAPHSDFAGAIQLVRHGVNAFLCAPNGDLYVIQHPGYAFVKSQGVWQYLNFMALRSSSDHLLLSVVDPIMRLALDLSFSRKGALFCVLADPEEDRRSRTRPRFAGSAE